MACTPKPVRRRVKPFKLAVEKLHRDHKRKHGKGSMLILDEIGMISDRDMRNAREQMRLSIQECRTFRDLLWYY